MFYWILLTVLIVLTVLFGLPDAFVGIGMVTFGLGMVVGVVAVNLLPLVASFLPIAVLPSSLKIPAVLVSIAIYAAYLLGPGMLAQRQADAFIAELTKDDIALAGEPVTARSFELHYATKPPKNSCPDACDALLRSGDADWVRVIYSSGLSLTFARDETGPKATEDTQGTADLILTQSIETPEDLARDHPTGWLLSPLEAEQFTLRHAAFPEGALYRDTRVDLRLWSEITFIEPHLTGTSSDGYSVSKRTRRGTAKSYLSILREYGFAKPTASPKTPPELLAMPSATDRSVVAVALAKDADTLSKADQRLISSYISTANGYSPLPADDLKLLSKIIKDPRFDRKSGIFKTLQREPDLRIAILPWVFETLEQRGSFESEAIHSVLMLSLRTTYTPQELAPYFDRYAELVETQKPVSDDLARVLGRFDTDPTQVFEAMISPTKEGLQTARHGLCGVDKKWHPALSTHLMRAFGDYIQNGGRLTTRLKYVAYVASAYGHRERFIALLQDQEKANDLFWDYLERYEQDPERLYNKYNGPCLLRL